jgi:DNA segregation ATPase FtsK/SpoIIIE, S-DNA-T family
MDKPTDMSSSNRTPEESPKNDWLDRLAQFNAHFGRFLRDVVGVALLSFGAMSLMALWGITRGVLLTPWGEFLKLWLGWGSYLFILALLLSGIFLLRREGHPVRFGWIITFELACFLTLGLLAVLGGYDLTRAELGMDGGRLGWGLSRFFTTLAGPTWGIVLLVFLWFVSTLGALNVWAMVETRLLHLAGTEPSHTSPTTVSEKSPHKTASKPGGTRKRTPAIPPEFRTFLRPHEGKDEKPVKPQPRGDRLPPLNLFSTEQTYRPDERTINQTAGLIMKTLSEFGIPAQVIGYRIGPAVTQFAVQPGFIKKSISNEDDVQQMKVRVAQIANLEKDLTLALSAERLRIEAPVPGKPYVGIEVPNSRTSMVRLRPILETDVFYKVSSPLAIALGRDVSGQPLVADLARMPHLLIAGATGSGKSVCVTSIAACLAINNAPEDLRLVLIDSKMVELLRFNGLPHLFGKVETDIQRILGVLRWVVVEMEQRYRLLESVHARDLNSYNRKLARRKDGVTPLPRIVVIIDELADLMMSAPDQTEHNLVRLAQMARATGIHLVVATQRPSTDVVTGLIKANFPARISFSMASGIDSRVILDTGGAETLLGRGDMLFLNPEVGSPIRAQGVMVTDQEIERLIGHWQKMTTYSEERAPWEKLLSEPEEGEDDGLIEQAISIVRGTNRASASLLQRRLRIGYPRAARLLDQLEEMGIVGESQGGGRERDVLIDPDDDMDEDN